MERLNRPSATYSARISRSMTSLRLKQSCSVARDFQASGVIETRTGA